MSKELTGKVALVTGGSRGIGAAIAKALADDGTDVAISYAASADKAEAVVKELRRKGVRAEAFKADQANAKEVEALVKAVAERFGRLDILVNNAAVFITGQLNDHPNNLAELERQFAINVGGVAAAVRAAVPVMSEGGRIISIGSVAGETSPWPGIADYSATKGAVAAFTRGWARDLGPRGITVNNVQPGPIDTDMNPASNGDFSAAQSQATALGRYGKPEEVAAAVVFLASPKAAYITGATLNVDGGMTA
jgi:3-oxoacyl-[acyl-carrier protein] reductase